MSDSPKGATSPSFDLRGVVQTPTTVYVNTDKELIIVTKDRLQLRLQDNVDHLRKRDRWMAPLGVLAALAPVVATATFSKRFGVSGGAWQTFFTTLALLALAWLIYSLKQRGSSITAASIVDELKKDSVEIPASPISQIPNLEITSDGVAYRFEPTSADQRIDATKDSCPLPASGAIGRLSQTNPSGFHGALRILIPVVFRHKSLPDVTAAKLLNF
jgi:hypothetical protein